MEKLYLSYNNAITRADTHFVRYLHDKIHWDNELNLILGCRGVGKTTLMLQHIKLSKEQDCSLYVTADNPYFSAHTLLEIAETFYKNGGKHLYIDEVHKYPRWSREVKMMHDTLDGLHVVLSGSSMIDLIRGLEVDLSRRAIPYRLENMSFREYLNFTQKTNIPAYSLDDILDHKVEILDTIRHPLPLFADYLKSGCYPFCVKNDFMIRLDNVVSQTLDVDIPQQINLSISSARKLKKLMYVIAQSTPFKPNLSNLGRTLESDRRTVADMLVYMERAGLLRQLREADDIMDQFAKVEKIYLNNTNLCYSLCNTEPDKGTLRETFFFSQMAVNHKVAASSVSDFLIDGHTFEVGGKNKKRKQVADVKDAYIVKDDIEFAYMKTIPLWMFGLNY